MSQRTYDFAWMGLMAGWYLLGIGILIFALCTWR
jgi:hypothetical protein